MFFFFIIEFASSINRKRRKIWQGMVRCGIDLEGLCSVFHSFPKAEVEKIYHEVHESCKADGVDLDRKINCL